MPRPRESPYIWTTWLARLLAGEASCEWASWFRSRYQDWTKPPSDFDQSQWMLDHTALVNRERASREALGYEVFTEGQNAFRLRGRAATLAGKPDLIAVKNGDAVITDAKTGKITRREDGEAVTVPPGPGPHLSVRGTEGTRAVPGCPVPGPRCLPRRAGGHPRQRGGREVHRAPRQSHTETGGGDASPASTKRPGMPVLRHHGGGLS